MSAMNHQHAGTNGTFSNGSKISKNDYATNGATDSVRMGKILPDWSTTYPSQSLRFLQTLEQATQIENSKPKQARLALDIIIVGAGLGGLSLAIALSRRGHSVRILEQAPKLGEVRTNPRYKYSS